jgi:hypothetical protein
MLQACQTQTTSPLTGPTGLVADELDGQMGGPGERPGGYLTLSASTAPALRLAPLEVVASRRTDGRPRQRGGRIARAESEVAGRLDRHRAAKSSSPSTTMVPSSLGESRTASDRAPADASFRRVPRYGRDARHGAGAEATLKLKCSGAATLSQPA